MRYLQVILSFLCFILISCGPGRPHVKTLQLNYQGNSELKSQSFASAMEKYIEALSHDPFIAGLHLNLGLTLEAQEQAEKALQSYSEAEKLALADEDLMLVFLARFNRAQLLGKAKRVDEALQVYQTALEIVPTSKEVKTNIELLTQGQQGEGGGDGQPQDSSGKGKDNKPKEDQDQKDDKSKDNESQDGEEEKPEQPKEMKQSPKYKPRPFEGKELSEGDVKKILGELKQQEERIRADYNRKEVKEKPRDKDW